LFYSSPFFGSTAAEAFRALGIFCSAPLLPQRRRDVYWDSATDCLLYWMKAELLYFTPFHYVFKSP